MLTRSDRAALRTPLFAGLAILALGDTAQARQTASTPAGAPAGGYDTAARAGAPVDVPQVIVTGTRDPHKTAQDSTSPIVVVTGKELLATGQTDLQAQLSRLVPSITTQGFINDAAALTDRIRLRGLGPDQTLVLVDGKRRHPTGNIVADAGPDQGATGVDIDMIPTSMIDHVEVLEDGAAAQYGSDAIAGVVNIILKKQPTGGSAQALFGQTQEGDGFTTDLIADQGASFGPDSYFHIGAQFHHTDFTNRGGLDTRTGTDVNEILGTPEQTRETLGFDAGKVIVPGKLTLYTFLTYGHRHGEAYENYRLPSRAPTIYPEGFSPIETLEENDYAATIGVKGNNLYGFHYDLSSTYGVDQDNVGIDHSVNPDLIAATGTSPTKFFLSGFTNLQWTNNLDISHLIRVPFVELPSNFAFGVEQRYEEYDITAGEPESYFGGGAQALPGLQPISAGGHSRDVIAGYLDYDIHPFVPWDVDLAGRFEHYTDFGDVEIGKVSSRYEIIPGKLAIRGTISNGFRAPTLAEEYFTNLNVSPTGAFGLLAPNSQAARQLGSVPLQPERSTNASAGIVLTPIRRLNVTADVYQINLRDRVIAGGNYNGQPAINAIGVLGISLPPDIDPTDVTAQYFSNGASTRTQGLDIVADYPITFGNDGTLDLYAAANLNRTRLHHLGFDGNGNLLLSAQGVGYITTGAPRSKLVLQGIYRIGRYDITGRQTRVGQTKELLTYDVGPNAFSNTVFEPFNEDPRWLTDFEFGYQLTRNLHLALGMNNAFNIFPRQLPPETTYLGVQRFSSAVSGVGIEGGFYYGRINVTW